MPAFIPDVQAGLVIVAITLPAVLTGSYDAFEVTGGGLSLVVALLSVVTLSPYLRYSYLLESNLMDAAAVTESAVRAPSPIPRRAPARTWEAAYILSQPNFRVAMPEDFMLNRQAWDATSDDYQAQHHEQLARHPQAWGIWSLPESELQLIGDVYQRDVLEFGCGGAEWCIALARRGARCTGLDNSARQLTHARAAIDSNSVAVNLVHGYAEHTQFADSSFDVVFCDHGAMSFADPEKTVPEVSRILRQAGIFAFSVEHPLHAITWAAAVEAPSRALHRSYFALGRQEDVADGGVAYVRPISAYVSLLIANGFVIEKLLEPRPPSGAITTYDNFASAVWATEFPAELMIRARRL